MKQIDIDIKAPILLDGNIGGVELGMNIFLVLS
ncbi:MAG: hypothetical protein ACI85I_001871 [Arenicella sp.]|jgi:hypothetical protein